tara:strand:+ start:126 stop:440 length:315 start_codon:yes stop_codon:yes gene_type:complete
MSIRTVLYGLIVAFLLSGCIASTQMASDGNYYRNIGGIDCAKYRITGNGVMNCYNKDDKYTGTKYAMTEQEILSWKLDDMQRQIDSNKRRAKRNANCQLWYYNC